MMEHVSKATALMQRERGEIIKEAMAMHAFQAVNYAIDLMEFVIKERDLGLPVSYSEMPFILESHGLITEEEARKIRRLIRFRNMVVHEYHIIGEEDIEKIVGELRVLKVLEEV